MQLEYTIVSKRKLNQLVTEQHVHGWDDPRMPTIAGLRRAGFTPKAIRDFCERIGLTKQNSWIEMGVLEYCIREDLNDNAPRAMAVLQPLRVVIDNYPEDQIEELEVGNHPQKPELGKRIVPFSKVILIEQDDFAEIPPAKFKRLTAGGEVRLRGSYVIQFNDVINLYHRNNKNSNTKPTITMPASPILTVQRIALERLKANRSVRRETRFTELPPVREAGLLRQKCSSLTAPRCRFVKGEATGQGPTEN